MAKTKSSPTRNFIFLAIILLSLGYYFQRQGFSPSFFSGDEEEIEIEIEEEVEIDVDSDVRHDIEALNLYVEVINRHSKRIFDSHARYLSWCNKETGPNGQEKHIYGLYSLYDYKNVSQQFEKAHLATSSIPEVEEAAEKYIKALNEVQQAVGEAYSYYDHKDYQDDDFAKGREMHTPLLAAFDTFKEVDTHFRATLKQPIARVLENEFLEAQNNQDHLLTWTFTSVIHARSLTQMGNIHDVMDLEVAAFTSQLDDYTQAIDSLAYYLESSQGQSHIISGMNNMVSRHHSLLKTGKELMRRARDKNGFSQAEKRFYTRNSGWMVSGSPAKLIKDYNHLLSNYNRIRANTELPQLLEESY